MQKIDTLVLTLRRGLAGKGQYKQAIMEYLGLKKTNQSVEVPNNFEFRATAKKVRLLLSSTLARKHACTSAHECLARQQLACTGCLALGAAYACETVEGWLTEAASREQWCVLQVQHLLTIETKDQYVSRINKDQAQLMGRPPILVTHRVSST